MRFPSHPAAVVSLILLTLASGMGLARATPMSGLALAAPSIQAAGQSLGQVGIESVYAQRYYHRPSGRYYRRPYRRAYPNRRYYGRPYYRRPYYGRHYHRPYPRSYYRPRYPYPAYHYPRRYW
jgi:hypothetical protein